MFGNTAFRYTNLLPVTTLYEIPLKAFAFFTPQIETLSLAKKGVKVPNVLKVGNFHIK